MTTLVCISVATTTTFLSFFGKEFVVIGTEMDCEKVEAALVRCLLTDEEMGMGQGAWEAMARWEELPRGSSVSQDCRGWPTSTATADCTFTMTAAVGSPPQQQRGRVCLRKGCRRARSREQTTAELAATEQAIVDRPPQRWQWRGRQPQRRQ